MLRREMSLEEKLSVWKELKLQEDTRYFKQPRVSSAVAAAAAAKERRDPAGSRASSSDTEDDQAQEGIETSIEEAMRMMSEGQLDPKEERDKVLDKNGESGKYLWMLGSDSYSPTATTQTTTTFTAMTETNSSTSFLASAVWEKGGPTATNHEQDECRQEWPLQTKHPTTARTTIARGRETQLTQWISNKKKQYGGQKLTKVPNRRFLFYPDQSARSPSSLPKSTMKRSSLAAFEAGVSYSTSSSAMDAPDGTGSEGNEGKEDSHTRQKPCNVCNSKKQAPHVVLRGRKHHDNKRVGEEKRSSRQRTWDQNRPTPTLSCSPTRLRTSPPSTQSVGTLSTGTRSFFEKEDPPFSKRSTAKRNDAWGNEKHCSSRERARATTATEDVDGVEIVFEDVSPVLNAQQQRGNREAPKQDSSLFTVVSDLFFGPEESDSNVRDSARPRSPDPPAFLSSSPPTDTAARKGKVHVQFDPDQYALLSNKLTCPSDSDSASSDGSTKFTLQNHKMAKPKGSLILERSPEARDEYQENSRRGTDTMDRMVLDDNIQRSAECCSPRKAVTLREPNLLMSSPDSPDPPGERLSPDHPHSDTIPSLMDDASPDGSTSSISWTLPRKSRPETGIPEMSKSLSSCDEEEEGFDNGIEENLSWPIGPPAVFLQAETLSPAVSSLDEESQSSIPREREASPHSFEFRNTDDIYLDPPVARLDESGSNHREKRPVNPHSQELLASSTSLSFLDEGNDCDEHTRSKSENSRETKEQSSIQSEHVAQSLPSKSSSEGEEASWMDYLDGPNESLMLRQMAQQSDSSVCSEQFEYEGAQSVLNPCSPRDEEVPHLQSALNIFAKSEDFDWRNIMQEEEEEIKEKKYRGISSSSKSLRSSSRADSKSMLLPTPSLRDELKCSTSVSTKEEEVDASDIQSLEAPLSRASPANAFSASSSERTEGSYPPGSSMILHLPSLRHDDSSSSSSISIDENEVLPMRRRRTDSHMLLLPIPSLRDDETKNHRKSIDNYLISPNERLDEGDPSDVQCENEAPTVLHRNQKRSKERKNRVSGKHPIESMKARKTNADTKSTHIDVRTSHSGDTDPFEGVDSEGELSQRPSPSQISKQLKEDDEIDYLDSIVVKLNNRTILSNVPEEPAPDLVTSLARQVEKLLIESHQQRNTIVELRQAHDAKLTPFREILEEARLWKERAEELEKRQEREQSLVLEIQTQTTRALEAAIHKTQKMEAQLKESETEKARLERQCEIVEREKKLLERQLEEKKTRPSRSIRHRKRI